MNNEVVEEVLGVDVIVRTNESNERTIRISNLTNTDESSIEVIRSNVYNQPQNKIVIKICCDNCKMEFI